MAGGSDIGGIGAFTSYAIKGETSEIEGYTFGKFRAQEHIQSRIKKQKKLKSARFIEILIISPKY
jgi:hypothetical protein